MPDGHAPSAPVATVRRTVRRLPPLLSLRAFEVVARHMSLLKAADELCVTPAAVSHQIRTLEAHLGLQLFHRAGRRMTLTDAAHAFLPHVREGFERFGQAVSQLQNLGDRGVLTVSVAPPVIVVVPET